MASETTCESGSQNDMDAILKIVQNKIRNLRKAIDRAKAIEAAAERGEELQPDQKKSLEGRPGKELVLSELEEILKKQTAIVTSSLGAAKKKAKEGNKPGKRGQKKSQENDSNTIGDSVDEQRPGADNVQDTAVVGDAPTAAKEKELPVAQDTSDASTGKQAAGPGNEFEAADAGVESMSTANSYAPTPATADGSVNLDAAVVKILSLLHVVEYASDMEAMKGILTYYEAQGNSGGRRIVSNDLERIKYFVLMLTSPNGDIPHRDAVETSRSHCVAYLNTPQLEAFPGTTYKALADISDELGRCPLLADRGISSRPDAGALSADAPGAQDGAVARDSAIAAVGKPIGMASPGDLVAPAVSARSLPTAGTSGTAHGTANHGARVVNGEIGGAGLGAADMPRETRSATGDGSMNTAGRRGGRGRGGIRGNRGRGRRPAYPRGGGVPAQGTV